MNTHNDDTVIENDQLCDDDIDQDILDYFSKKNTTPNPSNITNINDEKDDNKNTNNMDKKDIIVGIDLGTSNSCVGIWRNKNLEIIPDEYGNLTIPSVVSFTNRSKYVGKSAKNQLEINPANSFYEIKRLLGKKYDDTKRDAEFLTYNIASDEDNNVVIKSNLDKRKKEYTPEEIASLILMELKRNAESYLKTKIKKAVISVPAYYNDSQRQATKDAATIAGLECCRIINEPTAAALAYGLEKKSFDTNSDMYVLVYDAGGGTTDLSLLNISHGYFQVLASTGNTHLGGVDFDNRLISYCKSVFKKKHKIDKLEHLSAISLQRLRKACETAKKILSVKLSTIIAVKDFYENKNIYIPITRKQFENICKDLFILCLKPVEDILISSELSRDDIDEILLVGGTTKIPKIRENLKNFFRKEPNISINPDIVVAAGAAIQGYILANAEDAFSENVVLLDIIPLSLGVETIGGVMNVIIPRNSVIPIKRKRKYTTDSDYETEVKIKIYEGERKMTKDNFLVGEFILGGIEPAPRGVAEIEITFNVDINGIISVTAIDLSTNNKNAITITGNKGRLTKNKINKLVKEAAELEKRDRQEREKRQLHYEIEDLVSNVVVNIKNEEIQLKENDKEKVMKEIDTVIAWLKEKNYIDREKKEYYKVVKRLREKYGTLILKISHDKSNYKGMTTGGVKATSIYNTDEDDVYTDIENEELGISNDMTKEDVDELKQLRNTLTNL